jgi:hypothetical protein
MTKGRCLIKNTQGKCAKKVEIWGKRWFRRTYGNTYHTVRVYVDDELIGESEEEGGYGEQYIDTAFNILQRKGLAPKTEKELSSGVSKDWYDFVMDRRTNRNKYVIHVNDVPRERDLKWTGTQV